MSTPVLVAPTCNSKFFEAFRAFSESVQFCREWCYTNILPSLHKREIALHEHTRNQNLACVLQTSKTD